MFTVRVKDPPFQEFTVYYVKNNKYGFPQFLIYHKDRWMWKSATLFEPCQQINGSEN